MAKFNQKIQTSPNAISYEGGSVYTKTPAEDWLNFLFSSYLEDRFYETSEKQMGRFVELTQNMIDTYGAEFVAKAAMFARNELGMRSVSQVVAAMLNKNQFENKRNFFYNYCHRPDDISEVFSIINLFNDKRSHAAVRGFGDYLSSLSVYALTKYKMTGKEFNMYDLINITHPKSEVIDLYKQGMLKSPDTWEVNISTAKNEDDRNKEWKRLVEEKKLGYLALIRNLRNILSIPNIDDKWINTYLVPQLVNVQSIRKSLVFPYQIYGAYKNMEIRNPRVVLALSDAFKIALSNMPVLDGNTLIILDVSGSMSSPISYKSNITIREAGAVYAMCIILASQNSHVIKFASYAKNCSLNLNGNVFDLIDQIQREDGCGYSTHVEEAYRLINKKYDRIILISDMQIMDPRSYYTSAINSYEDYCKYYGRTPIYSFDLGNYSTQTSNPNNPDVYLCTSLSEKTLKFISLLEDGEDIVSYINNNYDYRTRH